MQRLMGEQALHSLATGDVLQHRDAELCFTARVSNFGDGHSGPDYDAVSPDTATFKFVTVNFPGNDSVIQFVFHLDVVRMRETRPMGVAYLLLAVLQHLLEGPVRCDQTALHVGQGNANGRVVEYGAKIGITFPAER